MDEDELIIESLPASRRAAEEASRILAEYGADETIARGMGAPEPAQDPSPPVGLRYAPDGTTEPRRGVAGGAVASLPLSDRARAVDERLRRGEAPEVEAEMMDAWRSEPTTQRQQSAYADTEADVSPEIEREALRALQRAPESPEPPRRMGARDLGSPAPVVDRPDPAALQAASAKSARDYDAKPDEGGPRVLTQSDVDAARVRDQIRSPFRAIGRALQVYGGMRPGQEGPGEAEQIEARMRQQGNALQRTKAAQEASRMRSEASAAQQADRDEARDIDRERLDMQRAAAEGRRALDERRTAAYESAQGSLASDREARRAAAEREVADMRDPASERSAAERRAYRADLEIARSTLGDDFALRIGIPDEQLDQMSAADIQAAGRGLRRIVPRGHRAPGGGGRGGGVSRDALIARAVEAGIPEEAARAMRSRDLASDIETRTRTRGGAAGAEESDAPEILPGSGIRAGSAEVSDTEIRQYREGWRQATAGLANLGELQRIQDEYGATAIVDPRARARVRTLMQPLRSMVAQMGGTGVINPSEVPTIQAALPDPTSILQQATGTVGDQMDEWIRSLETSVRVRAAQLGVNDAGTEELVRRMYAAIRGRGGATAAESTEASAPAVSAETAAPERVRVRLRDGREGSVPRDRLQRVLDAGGEVIDG